MYFSFFLFVQTISCLYWIILPFAAEWSFWERFLVWNGKSELFDPFYMGVFSSTLFLVQPLQSLSLGCLCYWNPFLCRILWYRNGFISWSKASTLWANSLTLSFQWLWTISSIPCMITGNTSSMAVDTIFTNASLFHMYSARSATWMQNKPLLLTVIDDQGLTLSFEYLLSLYHVSFLQLKYFESKLGTSFTIQLYPIQSNLELGWVLVGIESLESKEMSSWLLVEIESHESKEMSRLENPKRWEVEKGRESVRNGDGLLEVRGTRKMKLLRWISFGCHEDSEEMDFRSFWYVFHQIFI